VILVLNPRKRYTLCIAREGEKEKQTMNYVECDGAFAGGRCVSCTCLAHISVCQSYANPLRVSTTCALLAAALLAAALLALALLALALLAVALNDGGGCWCA